MLNFCHQCLSILHNYFDGPAKLFSNQYLTKFLDTLAKSFFTGRYVQLPFIHLFQVNLSKVPFYLSNNIRV